MDDPHALLNGIVDEHASLCGHCDAGLAMNCTCRDPRGAVHVLFGALRDVLDLHTRSWRPATGGPHEGQHYCTHCSRCSSIRDEWNVHVPYPCRTVRAITTQLGQTP